MLYICIVFAIFVGDLWVKDYMEGTLKEGEVRPKLGGVLRLRRYHNRGAFLNMGEKIPSLIVILSVLLTVIAAGLFVITLGKRGNQLLKLGLSLLLGGALNNTYDRLKNRYVRDYVSFAKGGRQLSDIVFNLSDIGIILGTLFIIMTTTQELNEKTS